MKSSLRKSQISKGPPPAPPIPLPLYIYVKENPNKLMINLGVVVKCEHVLQMRTWQHPPLILGG